MYPAMYFSSRGYLPDWKLMAEYSEFAEQEANSQEFAGINSEYSAIAMPDGTSKRYPLEENHITCSSK